MPPGVRKLDLNLYWGGGPTQALRVLRACNEPKGMKEPWSKSFHYGNSRIRGIVAHLCHCGLVEPRRSGPRGGKFYHTTEVGQTLAVIEDPELMATMLLLIYGSMPRHD